MAETAADRIARDLKREKTERARADAQVPSTAPGSQYPGREYPGDQHTGSPNNPTPGVGDQYSHREGERGAANRQHPDPANVAAGYPATQPNPNPGSQNQNPSDRRSSDPNPVPGTPEHQYPFREGDSVTGSARYGPDVRATTANPSPYTGGPGGPGAGSSYTSRNPGGGPGLSGNPGAGDEGQYRDADGFASGTSRDPGYPGDPSDLGRLGGPGIVGAGPYPRRGADEFTNTRARVNKALNNISSKLVAMDALYEERMLTDGERANQASWIRVVAERLDAIVAEIAAFHIPNHRRRDAGFNPPYRVAYGPESRGAHGQSAPQLGFEDEGAAGGPRAWDTLDGNERSRYTGSDPQHRQDTIDRDSIRDDRDPSSRARLAQSGTRGGGAVDPATGLVHDSGRVADERDLRAGEVRSTDTTQQDADGRRASGSGRSFSGTAAEQAAAERDAQAGDVRTPNTVEQDAERRRVSGRDQRATASDVQATDRESERAKRQR